MNSVNPLNICFFVCLWHFAFVFGSIFIYRALTKGVRIGNTNIRLFAREPVDDEFKDAYGYAKKERK